MDYFVGVITAITGIAVLVSAFLLGQSMQASHIADLCQDYGKVKINNKWYECRKV